MRPKNSVVFFASIVALAVVVGLRGPGARVVPSGGGTPAEAAPLRISEEQAIALAVNELTPSVQGLSLANPRHRASFSAEGMRFEPSRGPVWRWRFLFAGAGRASLGDIDAGAVRPRREGRAVVYDRGSLFERYLPGDESIEQEFVLPARPALGGGDLVLAGRIEAAGSFRKTEEGWLWQSQRGAVRLGDVTVFDALGRQLPARMTVDSQSTRIVVAGSALADAAYPVTVDPEIGANDFRISDMGPPDLRADASDTAVAYNRQANEYLVVWSGDDGTAPLADEEFEIFGQRLNAVTGAEVGTNDFRISDMGADGNASPDAFGPAIAYNGLNNEYLVVWFGDEGTAPLVDNEYEIFGQRLTAGGSEILPNDFRISDMGPDGNSSFSALWPALVYDSQNDEYLVVWWGDDSTAPLVDNEHEIFGQRLNAASGAALGTNDFRISDMGPDGNAGFAAFDPSVAYNSQNNECLVVWSGKNFGLDGDEIFGQRLNSASGAEVGTNDFQISETGPDGDARSGATDPSIAYNSQNNEYLVVWSGDDAIAPLVDNEFEIFGQRLSAQTGTEVGTNDYRISDMGPDGNASFNASVPTVSYNGQNNEYLVVWSGDDDMAPLVDNELEIFGQRLNATTGAEVGTNDFRLSDMGPDGNASFGVNDASATFNSQNSEYLLVWSGDDDTAPLVDDELEIFAQRLNAATGGAVGTNDFRISDMGRPDVSAGILGAPAVAYNSQNNEYLVVWSGDDATSPLVDNEYEIFGQRLNATTGAEVGTNDFRISDMGPDGNAGFAARDPAVAYNSQSNEYLVVWEGDDNTPPLADNESEIFGQLLTGSGSEIVPNDVRISDVGPDGNAGFAALDPAVAYDTQNNEYLVVWWGDDNLAPLVDDEVEIFGQRLDAVTLSAIGTNDFRISDAGPDGSTAFGAINPAIAYNNNFNEYLVVWEGDDNAPPLVQNEYEIFGQRLSAATGAALGTNDFRISDMGPDGSTIFGAFRPAIAYNRLLNVGEYLVVWYGDDGSAPLVAGELEIFGQRLNGFGGAEVGANDFRISDMGPEGNAAFDAFDPAVAYNRTNNEWVVVWFGDDDTAPLVYGELEIFGQRLNAQTGAEVGTNDFRLSDMGPNGSTSFAAVESAVAYNTANNEYLVVWYGDDNTAPLVDNEFEIFGQRYAPEVPTAVTVSSFTATAARAGVTLRWRTGSELGQLGFNLWRSATGGPYRKLNAALIAARGAARGATYRYLDRTARPGSRYVYRLELVALDGARCFASSLRVSR